MDSNKILPIIIICSMLLFFMLYILLSPSKEIIENGSYTEVNPETQQPTGRDYIPSKGFVPSQSNPPKEYPCGFVGPIRPQDSLEVCK